MSLVTLTANSWCGPPPTPGTFLKSARGRAAYEIVEYRSCRPGSKTAGRLRCRRTEPAEIPDGATVFAWCWSKR